MELGMDCPLEAAWIPGRGRGLIATRDLHEGEVVLRESPLVAAVRHDAKLICCGFCFRMRDQTSASRSPSPSQCRSGSQSESDASTVGEEECVTADTTRMTVDAPDEASRRLPVVCKRCEESYFCDEQCHVAASRTYHSEVACKALSLIGDWLRSLSSFSSSSSDSAMAAEVSEMADDTRFLIAAYDLQLRFEGGGERERSKAEEEEGEEGEERKRDEEEEGGCCAQVMSTSSSSREGGGGTASVTPSSLANGIWMCHTRRRIFDRLSPLAPTAAGESPPLSSSSPPRGAGSGDAFSFSSVLDVLMQLEGEGVVDERVLEIHKFLEKSLELPRGNRPAWFSAERTAALLAKEKRNSYSLMYESLQAEGDGDGGTKMKPVPGVRAYAIYPVASLINHGCLPNVARFDYLDKQSGDGNKDIILRAMHDIPLGTEVTISYFPINWTYKQRQERLREEYGFECRCVRCRLEKTWSDAEEGEEEGESGDRMTSSDGEEDGQLDTAGMGKHGEKGDVRSNREKGKVVAEDRQMSDDDAGDRNAKGCEEGEESNRSEGEDDADDFPHAMFFVKYLCPREGCRGTMAPLPGSFSVNRQQYEPSGIMECNVCGSFRTDDEFAKDLEEHGMI